KRLDFLDSILRNLDIIIYAELSAVYYMDNSLLRFMMRSFVQLANLSPKPAMFNQHKHQPYVGTIVLANVFCLVVHVISSRPFAGENARGYLHGSILIDIIGQRGPTSRIHILLLDLLILGLQLVMLTAVLERQKQKHRVSRSSRRRSPQSNDDESQTTSQDHDAEERGVIRESSE
ncbi:DUF1746-domain-containing protein, partial [Aulographum hederae CBS 113979]